MQAILIILAVAVAGLAVWQTIRLRRSSTAATQLIEIAEPLEQHPDNPDRSILIIGDSLWAGVGARDMDDSMAGRLVADLPDARVVNKAESGARIADGQDQLAAALAETETPFDQIIIQLGANDILRFSDLATAQEDLRLLLEKAEAAAPDVAYMVSSSVGFAPVFLQPLDWFYSFLSRRYLDVFSTVARAVGVEYIDLYRSRKNDPFYHDPQRYYARDLFHPSGAGYGVWYGKCQNQLQCFQYDEAEKVSSALGGT